jgi:hypothetical protein
LAFAFVWPAEFAFFGTAFVHGAELEVDPHRPDAAGLRHRHRARVDFSAGAQRQRQGSENGKEGGWSKEAAHRKLKWAECKGRTGAQTALAPLVTPRWY